MNEKDAEEGAEMDKMVVGLDQLCRGKEAGEGYLTVGLPRPCHVVPRPQHHMTNSLGRAVPYRAMAQASMPGHGTLIPMLGPNL
ncbi:hypothetical protein MRB53_028899 [Persea americana]|uniref:Uncharacterized protein n=1 Tax=Persea americana TaxID=3435 RepID=A0ACC2KGU9_PERAE|nr:hypothetical protein MRB53_028899 [Persea americana]